MGFSSQAGQVLLRTQTQRGVFNSDTGTNGVAMKLRSGSLGTNRDLLIPDPEIGGGRDIADGYLGAVVWSGDYEFYARLNSLPTLLRACLGLANQAGTKEVQTLTESGTITGGTYTITFNGSTTSALAYNATNATVQAALNGLQSMIDVGGVVVTGGPVDTTALTLTFNIYGDMPAVTCNTASLTGTTPGITVATTTAGTATATVIDSGKVWKHTIVPSDLSSLPFLSIEEKIGSGLETYNYTDAVVNSLHFEAEANGYLQGTAGIIAGKQTAGNTPTAAPTWDNTSMIVGTNITVTYNSVSMAASSFSIDINNNFEDDYFKLGSFYVGDLTPKGREVTASFNLRPSSSALWRQATYGTSAATQVGGISTKNALVITCQTYEYAGTSTSYVGELKFTIPNFVLKPYSLEMSGDDIIENDIEGQGFRPSAGSAIMTVEVQNALSTIY